MFASPLSHSIFTLAMHDSVWMYGVNTIDITIKTTPQNICLTEQHAVECIRAWHGSCAWYAGNVSLAFEIDEHRFPVQP